MKTTGIIRRIDDLGRIVIPKEIRNSLRIKSGENLEIFLNDEEIILKKYSEMETLKSISEKYMDAIYKTIKRNIMITDRNKVVLVEGPLKNKYLNKEISDYLDNLLEKRTPIVEKTRKVINFCEGIEELCTFSFSPIINNGDVLGSVIIVTNDVSLTDVEDKLPLIISKILSEYFVN